MNSGDIFRFDLLTILGPTACGKTRLAVEIAHNLSGEIISADSRQVFRKLNIGTGKDLIEYQHPDGTIPHHLIDIIDPADDYSVFHFQNDFYNSYLDIKKKHKQPILCGGTGLYIEAILRHFSISPVKPNIELRKELDILSIGELQEKLKSIKSKHHNTSDFLHKKRLIRAIEIALSPVPEKSLPVKIEAPVIIGIDYPRSEVRNRITLRLHERINEGLIEEVEDLIRSGVTHERLEYFGLEYRFISRFIEGKLNKNDMIQKLNSAIHQFSKRQMTFFRHMEKQGIKIHWIPKGNQQQAFKLIENWTK